MLTKDLKTIPDLFGDAAQQLEHLIGTEAQLAGAEVLEKIQEAGKGLAYVAIAATLVIPAIVMVLLALASWLTASGLAPAVSYLVAGAAGAGLGLLFLIVGLKHLKPKNLALTKTRRQLNRDVVAAKELVG